MHDFVHPERGVIGQKGASRGLLGGRIQKSVGRAPPEVYREGASRGLSGGRPYSSVGKAPQEVWRASPEVGRVPPKTGRLPPELKRAPPEVGKAPPKVCREDASRAPSGRVPSELGRRLQKCVGRASLMVRMKGG